MIYKDAISIAAKYLELLRPDCERIEIAGSIRRRKSEVKDIEIVAIPKPYEVGLFQSGVAAIVNQWQKVKGELPCKYTQRILPEGIKMDLFFAEKENWGLIYAIRTGSADFSHFVLADGWVKAGYKSDKGMLTCRGASIPVYEEQDLFRMIGIKYISPEYRELRR